MSDLFSVTRGIKVSIRKREKIGSHQSPCIIVGKMDCTPSSKFRIFLEVAAYLSCFYILGRHFENISVEGFKILVEVPKLKYTRN